MFGAGAFRSLQSIAAPRDQRQNQPELRMRLVLPDLDMISGAFVFSRLHYTQRQILSNLPENPIHLP